MKVKKGICLLLCILWLVCLLPAGTLAAVGPEASICLTGASEKTVFSADSAIEEQILHPNEQTEARYLLPDGVSYDAPSNTLTLSDYNDPGSTLVLTAMGGDFRIRLTGSSSLTAVRSDSLGWGGSVTFTGDGALSLVNYGGPAVAVNAGGTADFVCVEPQVRLELTGLNGAILVSGTALGDGAIRFDTASPDVRAEDSSEELTGCRTSDGKQIDVCAREGEEGLFGLEAVIDTETDPENPAIVYNVYRLGGTDETGAYSAEETGEVLPDTAGFTVVSTPHEWSLVEIGTGAPASQLRLARFAVSAQANDENGSVSVSPSAVGRGGSAVVTATPNEGYKLSSLTVNGVEVTAVGGSYTIGGITADQTVEASFAEAQPTDLTVTPPSDTAFPVPGADEEEFISEPFGALITDGAGDPVGASVVWSVEPTRTGVSIREDGRVCVSSAVKDTAANGPIVFTVTAALEGTELSGSAEFTVSLSERRAASLSLTREGEKLGESDSVTIPETGSVEVSYGAVIYDQYGDEMETESSWVAGDWPAGVSRQNSTLTVTSETASGSTLDVTASAASDSAVSATVTVSFVRPERVEPTAEEGGEETGGEEIVGEETVGEKTGEEKTNGEKTVGEETGEEKTVGEKTVGEKTGGEKTAEEETVGEKTGGEKTGGEKTVEEETGEEKTGEEKTGGEKTVGEESVGEKTGGEETGGEKTGGEKTGGEETGGEKTVREETSGEKTVGEKTVGEKTGGEETGGEKTVEEKTVEEKTGEEETGGEKGAPLLGASSDPESTPASEPTETPGPDADITVSWPGFTLASDAVYGLKWTELVTLDDEGAARRGEEEIEGVFSVKVESAIPNISDSFTILFTYTEGETTRTAESEAHAVTLAPKALEDSMITLSPAEMPYSGTACEPAVSLKYGELSLSAEKDFVVTGFADNVAIGSGTVTVEGRGNYTGTASKSFAITAIPVSAVTDFVTSRKPEDEGTEPTIELIYGEETLTPGVDYDVTYLYDLPAKSGTATITLKGIYSGTIVSRFDLPNYLITAGAGSSWNKGATSELRFTANGALSKFTEVTVDGKTVDPSYYSTESGSTIVSLKPNYLKSLSAGKHIIGVAYRDGKALAIFSVTDINRRGVATGDENDLRQWILILALSALALAAVGVLFAMTGKKKKKRKKKTTRK